jgi:hypothetical protein
VVVVDDVVDDVVEVRVVLVVNELGTDLAVVVVFVAEEELCGREADVAIVDKVDTARVVTLGCSVVEGSVIGTVVACAVVIDVIAGVVDEVGVVWVWDVGEG